MSIEIKNCSFAYNKIDILKNLSLKINKGEIITIAGPNGSGKSTLLKLISKNLKPKTGKIFINNKPLEKYSNKMLSYKLAVLFQNQNAPVNFTVYDLVKLGRYPYHGFGSFFSKEHREIINQALHLTGIYDLKNRLISNLSGGECQRAWIAMILAQKPEIMLLDEPTTFLDICHQFELLELLKKLNAQYGYTIIMVLHDLNQAAKYSHRIAVIHEKKILKTGKPGEIIEPVLLKKVFNINARILYDDKFNSPYFLIDPSGKPDE